MIPHEIIYYLHNVARIEFHNTREDSITTTSFKKKKEGKTKQKNQNKTDELLKWYLSADYEHFEEFFERVCNEIAVHEDEGDDFSSNLNNL